MENDLEYQEDTALVVEVKKGFVTVEISRTGACASCGMSGICVGKNQALRHRISTDMDLRSGDQVKLHISSGVKLLSSFLIFVMPIIFMILFYFSAKHIFGFREEFAIIISFTGLLVSGILIYLADKRFAGKIHFEIVEKVINEDTFK
ncbi:MAG: SoxR reducing system RseC family protein [Candidatus Cloacimonetes bacterium]|nr:SoxR reducing system RseC family protein [Candidatus Cloacimonadota bacterium]